MLSATPILPLPRQCMTCEFSFCIDNRTDYNLYLCTYYNVHVPGRAPLCPFRERLNYPHLAELLGICVPPWQIASDLIDLGDIRGLEAIRNEICETTGLKLANTQRIKDEKPPST
jgi:hypothetical protein